MPSRFLLDTNILSDLVRHPDGQIASQISHFGEKRVCTSIIVASELRFGAQKKDSARLTKQLDLILSAMTVEPLETPVEYHYGKIRHYLERQGKPIGPNDLLIAAHTLTLGCHLVTANINEFNRVPELSVVNWLDA